MKHLRHLVVPAAVCLLGSSCDIVDVDPDGRLVELESRREQWLQSGIQQYRMEFRASCFCGLEFTELVTVDVLQDTVRSVTVVSTGLPVENLPLDTWPTVEELFAAVEQAIVENAHELQVTYDADLGYPAFVFIDRDEMAIDEEIGYQVFELEVVE